MFDDVLIESAGKDKKKGGWITALISTVIHIAFVGSRVQPQHTEIARKARVQGIVIIEAVIDRNGHVTEARVLKPLPMGLDQQALQAIRQWKFKPGTLNGQAVPVYYNLTVNFRIE